MVVMREYSNMLRLRGTSPFLEAQYSAASLTRFSSHGICSTLPGD